MEMNWKREAEHKLRNYAAKKRATQVLPQQIEEVRLRRQGVRGARMDGVAAGGGNGREAMLVDSIVYQEALEKRLEAEKLWVAGVENALAELSEEERLVLDRCYIHAYGGSVERLCEELCVERASVYRKRNRAIRKFTMAMYGWEE